MAAITMASALCLLLSRPNLFEDVYSQRASGYFAAAGVWNAYRRVVAESVKAFDYLITTLHDGAWNVYSLLHL